MPTARAGTEYLLMPKNRKVKVDAQVPDEVQELANTISRGLAPVADEVEELANTISRGLAPVAQNLRRLLETISSGVAAQYVSIFHEYYEKTGDVKRSGRLNA